jgi:hypothetical protein
MEYGEAKMRELLLTFREGTGYDAALEKVYGFDTDGLNYRWQEEMKRSLREENTAVWRRSGVVNLTMEKAFDYLDVLVTQVPLLQVLYEGAIVR